MLDPKLLRNDLDLVVTQLARKGVEFDVSAYQALEAKRKSLQLETESLQNQRSWTAYAAMPSAARLALALCGACVMAMVNRGLFIVI